MQEFGDFIELVTSVKAGNMPGIQFTIHGEYFGPKIMNRIYYGNKYMFRFFGMSIVTDDGKARSMAFREFQTFMEFLGLRKYVVPVLGIFKSFDDACRMPTTALPLSTTKSIVIPWKAWLFSLGWKSP